MTKHAIAMEITKLEHGDKRQINIAEATAAVYAFGRLLRSRNVFSALWLAFWLRWTSK